MDNLPAHERQRALREIEARGAARWYLRVAPDLNPIKMPFSKLKAYLLQGGRAEEIPGLRRQIKEIFARNLTAREAKNYFRHAGYA